MPICLLFIFMIKKLIKYGFSATADVLSTKNLKKFGCHDYPEALSYSRPFSISKTHNGITVATEAMQSHIARYSISVFIKCGSRNQTQETSGVAHFLEHLHFKGTANRTRNDLQLQVQNIGGNLNAYTSRQNTSYMMTVFRKDIKRAIEIVGDMLTNSLYRKQDVENERSTIHRELLETRKTQPLETTIQIAHRGIFKGQQIGLPILGDLANMETIDKQMIEDYHNTNYVGQNIIVVASGDINHDELVESVGKNFRVAAKGQKKVELIKPKFCPGLSMLESSLSNLVNMVIVHQAPSFFQSSFFTYLLLQRIVADRPANQFQLQIMKNSNCFKYQKFLAKHEFIHQQKGFYSSYWDTGLYGNYFLIEPERFSDVVKLNLQAYENYANKISDEQLQRAKRRVYNEIMHHQSQNDITQSTANNLMYYNRRVHTKELAERVACVTAEDLKQASAKVYRDVNNLHVCLWGNVPKQLLK